MLCKECEIKSHTIHALGQLWITQSVMFTRQMLLKHKINTQAMSQILLSLLCVKYIFFWFFQSRTVWVTVIFKVRLLTACRSCYYYYCYYYYCYYYYYYYYWAARKWLKYENKLGNRMVKQLLNSVMQNILICQCLADQLFASAFGFAK